MQNTNTKQFAPKVKWTQEEIKVFTDMYPIYKLNFKKYTKHLNRSYSQIKGFYHNNQHKLQFREQPDTRVQIEAKPVCQSANLDNVSYVSCIPTVPESARKTKSPETSEEILDSLSHIFDTLK
ncbi:Conserved_hypothetical protein [Hexamita inflata]|uniref:Uncharacterized protein n=1 Tax=Hexamita inflata TaxID=28002 RepID=A0AA86QZE2_9EUKA|nr:Conserved hypothetical protein [Hexamita inflata]